MKFRELFERTLCDFTLDKGLSKEEIKDLEKLGNFSLKHKDTYITSWHGCDQIEKYLKDNKIKYRKITKG